MQVVSHLHEIPHARFNTLEVPVKPTIRSGPRLRRELRRWCDGLFSRGHRPPARLSLSPSDA